MLCWPPCCKLLQVTAILHAVLLNLGPMLEGLNSYKCSAGATAVLRAAARIGMFLSKGLICGQPWQT